jgi:hypothetical protein
MARNIPIFVALFLFSTGSFPVAIDMKMMLSIPKTISRNVNVNKAIQALGFKNTSILFSWGYEFYVISWLLFDICNLCDRSFLLFFTAYNSEFKGIGIF